MAGNHYIQRDSRQADYEHVFAEHYSPSMVNFFVSAKWEICCGWTYRRRDTKKSSRKTVTARGT